VKRVIVFGTLVIAVLLLAALGCVIDAVGACRRATRRA
jgi:hypothetical protein